MNGVGGGLNFKIFTLAFYDKNCTCNLSCLCTQISAEFSCKICLQRLNYASILVLFMPKKCLIFFINGGGEAGGKFWDGIVF